MPNPALWPQWLSSLPAGPATFDPASGNLMVSLDLPQAGPFAAQPMLSYSLRAAQAGIQYGAGVADSFTQVLQVIDDETVTIIKGDGTAWTFTDFDSGTGLYVPPPGVIHTLQRTATGWTETQPDGLELLYEELSELGWLDLDLDDWLALDLEGWLSLELGAFGRLSEIRTPAGASWLLSYDGSERLQAITNAVGGTTTYSIYPHAGHCRPFLIGLTTMLTKIKSIPIHNRTEREMQVFLEPEGDCILVGPKQKCEIIPEQTLETREIELDIEYHGDSISIHLFAEKKVLVDGEQVR